MLEKAKETTQRGSYTPIEYVRFADDLIILVDGDPRHAWLEEAVQKRLREELGKIQVKLNERKSRLVDTRKGESFGFLGFDFRRQKGRSGKWWVKYTPKMKKRRELTRKLKDIFKRFRSQPISRVIHLINPVLRGWVNYFAWGHSSTCFRYLRSWVEKKVRRHLMGARGRRGFGWKRWSGRWIYDVLGLFDAYRVKWNRPLAKARPT